MLRELGLIVDHSRSWNPNYQRDDGCLASHVPATPKTNVVVDLMDDVGG